MIGKVLDGRYEIVQFIGKGGMALVYRAIDLRTRHQVAVKILQPEFNQDKEFLSRFEREATTASKVFHHNIVNLLDVGQDGDLRYIVMEYVQGRTLKDLILEKGALPPNVAEQIGIRILSALQHAHKNGIIHRDIKPQNILIHTDGHVKVADFGIARVAGSNTITKGDYVMGSVHYFSPEQARGEEVTCASDLYSVGVVLYEMLTGQPPFTGDTPVSIALQHISATPRPIREINPSVPPALEMVVRKAMEKRIDLRYQSAREMAEDLQRAMREPEGGWMRGDGAQQGGTPPSGGEVKPASVHVRRSIQNIAGVTAMTVVVVAAVIWGAVALYDRIANTTEAPYLLDETEQSAQRIIERAGLKMEISRASDEIKPQGVVIMQSPEYGTAMRKNETILVTISTGKEEQPIPDCRGYAIQDARDMLEESGFLLLALPDRVLSELPWGTVVNQTPEAGTVMASGSVIQAQLSGGLVILPEMNNMPLQEAQELINQLHLTLTEIREIPCDDATLVGRVAAQQFTDGNLAVYQPGEQAMEYTQVTLAVYVSAAQLQNEAEAEGIGGAGIDMPAEEEAP